MAAKVDRKKLLKQPDEFLTFSDRAVKWARDNLQRVLIIASAVVAALVVVLAIKAYLDFHQRQAAAALAPVMSGYQAVVEGKADQKMMASLAEQLTKVTNDYGATPAGMQARLALGDLLLTLARFPQAAKVFQVLSEEPDLPAELAPMAWRGLGQAQEGAKNYAAAASSYGRAADLAGPHLRRLCLLDRARVLGAAGDKKAAADILRKLLADPAAAEVAERAKVGLSALGLEASGG
ncbi:MAG: hypothetical protein C4525_04040 [Desulfarculus sp.]|nr:MAG: hypothetical protein C4525_04040 [Desulfarculus sp.]